MRGDKKVDYGTMMRVMGRLSAAGFRRVALVTEVEQGAKAQCDENGDSDIGSACTQRCCCGRRCHFPARPSRSTPAESLPVDLVSDKDFSQMTKGVKDAPKVETPKPLVEKKAEASRRSRSRTSKAERSREKKEVAEPSQEPKPPPSRPSRSRIRAEPSDPIAEEIKTADEAKKQQTEGRADAAAAEEAGRRSRSRSSTPTRSRRCSTSATRSATPRPAKR